MAATQREVTNALVCDPVLKQQVADKALAAFRKHGTIARAASVAKVDRRTLKGWIANDPIMKMAFQDADDDVTDDIEECAIQKAKDGDGRVIVHLLASRNKRYAHRSIVEVSQTLNLDNVVQKMRQIAIAQPTLAPTIKAALQLALEAIP